jgi:hypothetical protein
MNSTRLDGRAKEIGMTSSNLKHAIRSTVGLRIPNDVRELDGIFAGLLGKDLVDVVAAKEPLHRVFANLRDDEAVLGFIKRWGRVTRGGAPKTLRDSQELMVGASQAEELSRNLRTAHPESEGDWDAPILFFESRHQIIQLRDMLQKAWDSNKVAIQTLEETVKEQIASTWAFKKGYIEITAEASWDAACLLFLRDRAEGKMAICANPACDAPYFIKKRKTQQVCEAGDCAKAIQRHRTGEWWKKHGNQWREQRAKAQKKRGKK